MKRQTAWLLDLYPERDRMVLWFIADSGERLRLVQPFAPPFFVDGLGEKLSHGERKDFYRSVNRAPELELIGPAERLDFWTGRPRRVLELRMADLNRCKQALIALADRFPALDFYNCDIAPEIAFGYETGLFPTARCEIAYEGNQLLAATLRDDPLATGYELPPLRIVELTAEGNLIGKRPRLASLSLTYEGQSGDVGRGGKRLGRGDVDFFSRAFGADRPGSHLDDRRRFASLAGAFRAGPAAQDPPGAGP